ncbi:MAG: hypothetical protein MUP53_08970 [Bacteroidales bacterium]|nr:hypothetical protein [Bacteroidales bacterium]
MMRRDGVSREEAERHVAEVRESIGSGEVSIMDMDDICMDEFGLEPDYLEELLEA